MTIDINAIYDLLKILDVYIEIQPDNDEGDFYVDKAKGLKIMLRRLLDANDKGTKKASGIKRKRKNR